MIQHHNWSLTELDNMIPYERAIYVDMLKEWVDSENSKMEQEQAELKESTKESKRAKQEHLNQKWKVKPDPTNCGEQE